MVIFYRPGTILDTYATFQVFMNSALDLSQRQGVVAITGGDDPAVLDELWERRRSLMEHLTRSAEQFWVAENDGKVIGYARSILRSSQAQGPGSVQHLELTEFFVQPDEQSRGVGSELLRRVFPVESDRLHRSILATTDSRALALYLRSNVYRAFRSLILSVPLRSSNSQLTWRLCLSPQTINPWRLSLRSMKSCWATRAM
jgi:GNAT superfamily N-acetyltransferase